MPQFKKGEHTVKTEVPSEITNLKARGYEAVKPTQDAEQTPKAPSKPNNTK